LYKLDNTVDVGVSGGVHFTLPKVHTIQAAGNTKLYVDDYDNFYGDKYTISKNRVETARGFITNFSGTTDLDVLTSRGGTNDILVNSTPANGKTWVLGPDGATNRFTITYPSGNLWNIGGPLELRAGNSSVDELILWDDLTASNSAYGIGPDYVFRAGLPTITYVGMEKVTLYGASGNNTFNVLGTSTASTTINAGGGADTFLITYPSGNLSNLWGSLTIDGQDGADVATLYDDGNSGFHSYTVTSTLITRTLPTKMVTYVGLENLTLRTSKNTNTINLTSSWATTPVNIVASGAINTLVGSTAPNTFTITGTNAGTVKSSMLQAPVSFSGMSNLTGGWSADTFVFQNGKAVTGSVRGEGGVNSLDYSGYLTSVTVNLRFGEATGTGSITGIQQVFGGNGGPVGSYNLLVGNGGNTLVGGNGRRNILIAGSSASILHGGDGDDLLVGGRTTYDNNPTALAAVVAEWTRTDKTYAERVANLLSGGGLNGSYLLNSSSVFSNWGWNTLLGKTGLDLFFGSTARDTNDWSWPSETFVSI
jgi:hypothetical protein